MLVWLTDFVVWDLFLRLVELVKTPATPRHSTAYEVLVALVNYVKSLEIRIL